MLKMNKYEKLTIWVLISIVGFMYIVLPQRHFITSPHMLVKLNPSALSFDWDSVRVDQLTPQQIMEYLKWTNSSACRLTNGFGGAVAYFVLDGQKTVCLDPEVRLLPGECLVYSFGVNDEWSFEDQMENFGCDVFAFDPSMNQSYLARGKKIRFFGYGLSNMVTTGPNGWQMKRLSDFYVMLEPFHNSTRVIDYLKIDIEGDEWKALSEIIESGMMDRVRQLAIEVHLPVHGTLDEVRRAVGIMRSLEEYGMVRFDSKINPLSETKSEISNMTTYGAYEIAWYNSKLARSSHYYWMQNRNKKFK